MAREEIISSALGFASIGCWLFAQFPQMVVNWKRKSVDGLALPFLANWFFGDITNLIGCILTHQLPFQTYFAIYAVTVDSCLLIQYYIYGAGKGAKVLSALESQSYPSPLPASSSYSPHVYTPPHTDRTWLYRSHSMSPHPRATVGLETWHVEVEPGTWDRNTPSESAGLKRSGTGRSGSLEGRSESVIVIHTRDLAGRPRPESHDGKVNSELIPFDPAASFRSAGWNTSDVLVRGRCDDPTHAETPSTSGDLQQVRLITDDHGDVTPASPFQRTRTTSTASNASAAATRRIVLLGVFALFGLSTRTGLGYRMRRDVQGEVLTVSTGRVPFEDSIAVNPPANHGHVCVSVDEDTTPRAASDGGAQSRLIGSISAWTCTTMYLTSRLPQIWKNFVRKSVEVNPNPDTPPTVFLTTPQGLSMYLFVFAVFANLLYVLSILASPKMDLPPPQAAQFLRGSIPYLLGSGGNLIFDITILMQSVVYAKRTPFGISMWRLGRKRHVGESGEEERALLAADTTN